MKTFVFTATVLLSATVLLQAQTAGELVASGRTNLCAHNLAAAHLDFEKALIQDPSHPEANVLAAATRLLLLPQQAAVSNLLNKLGIAKSGRDIYNWTADFTTNGQGRTVFPNQVNTSEAVPLIRSELLPAIRAAGTNLARVTDTNFLLEVNACETGKGGTDITLRLDYADVQMLRTLLHAVEALGYTMTAHNFGVVINRIQALGEADSLSISKLLSEYPSLLSLANRDDLAKSRTALTNAIAQYFVASEQIRDTNRACLNCVFMLNVSDTNDTEFVQLEEKFRTTLPKFIESLDQPFQFEPDDEYYIYAGAYFQGTKPVRSLMPKFDGDRYIPNTMPDYTMGGVLVGMPPSKIESLLRNEIGRTYPGYYSGTFSGPGPNPGSLAMIVRTNNHASIGGAYLGYNTTNFVADEDFIIETGGSWSVDKGTWGHGGNIYFGQSGYEFHGWIWREDGQGGEFFGSAVPLDGPYKSQAGYYPGTWSGGGHSGKLKGILAPNGHMGYIVFASASDGSAPIDSGHAEFPVSDATMVPFESMTFDGNWVTGTLNRTTFKISGTVQTEDGKFSFSFGRTDRVLPPLVLQSPTIVQQPADQTVAAGANAVFTVKATGAAPLYYQWWHGSLPVWKGTTATLALPKVGNEDAGEYWVTVGNPSATTNSFSAILNVSADPKPPTVTIDPLPSGGRVSNAVVKVTGTARDNQAVQLVEVRLNGGDWQLATTTNLWAKWFAEVEPLGPGSTNVIQARSMDAATNYSVVFSKTITYVVSELLKVEVVGLGKIAPNYTNQWLEVSKNVTLTATPKPSSGQVFSNWMQLAPLPIAVLTNKPTLKFEMQSNLVLQVNFVTNPFPAIKGTYLGLFFPDPQVYPNQQEVTNSGAFKLTLTDKGVASGAVTLGGRAYSFGGLAMDLDGTAKRQLKRAAPLAPLDLDLAITNGMLRGQVSSTDWESILEAHLVRGDTNQAGLYTFMLPGGDVSDTDQPTGYGAGTITVDKKGSVRLAGLLGEGTSLTVGSGLSADGWCPLYAPLYAGRGMMMGWIQFGTNDPVYDVVGTNLWLKAAATTAKDKYYRAGFGVNSELLGSRYVAPKAGTLQSVTDWTNAVVWLEGGNLVQTLTNGVAWVKNRLVPSLPNTNKVALSVTTSSGLWTGSFTHPETRRKTTMRGALLQQGRILGAGWFLGTNVSGRVLLREPYSPPTNVALIPAGSFTMGDTFGEGDPEELPTNTVFVSAFYMDRTEVTKALWDEVYTWATNHGYIFDDAEGKAANHPAQNVSWYDAVKWCNARSEREGWIPAYYTNAAQTTVYRNGQVFVENDWVNWNSGYRLPTEAEWEKAARGGASGHRFPWADVETITHFQANYFSSTNFTYDINPTSGDHPNFNDGTVPYTSPAGQFAPNGYGLYDMAGNVFEWCWDWYGPYPSGPQDDPRGSLTGYNRVYRGGGCANQAFDCRTAFRTYGDPTDQSNLIGFRSVLPPGQP